MDTTNQKISSKTMERVQIAKSYIEKKYKMKKENEEQKKLEWEKITKKMEEMKLSEKEKDIVKKEVFKVESEFLRLTRKKISIKDFVSLSIIGRGAFGEVRVCKEKSSGEIVAIKKMRKDDMSQKNQILHVRTEREIMISSNNPWVVSLKYSFQDDFHLYLVMDFLPGGDLMSLLIKKDIFTEEEARFYISEIVLAIEALHNMGCIHRDLKPDNILIDRKGHIKLSDFGLSKLSDTKIFPLTSNIQETNELLNNTKTIKDENFKHISKNKPSQEEIKNKRKDRLLAYSTVGTPDYIAPEVFGQTGYGPEVDWWSVGVILFEMLVGFPPFFSENPGDTCQKIVRWRKYFNIPNDSNLSIEAENLIRKLIASPGIYIVNPPENRLGSNGVEAIKNHPFFKGVDWNNIRKYTAPFIPELSSDYDNKYFDKFDEEEPFYPMNQKIKKGTKDNAFLNYTYKKENENKKNGFQHALEVMDVIKVIQNNEKIVHQDVIVKSDVIVRDSRRNTFNSKISNEFTNTSSNSYNNIVTRNSSNQSPREIETKTDERRIVKSKEKVEKSNSSDSKLDTNSNSSSNQAIKFSGKIKIPLKNNVNMIPLKKSEIPHPKLKETLKEKKMFLTPRENKDQLILKDNHPTTSKNISSNKITFEKNKYAQKIYEDIKQTMKNNSQSPTNKEYNNGSISSRSSDIYNKKNKIS